MTFEKISDNAIRCTLTSADLQERGIELSQLTYGSGPAQDLFNELVEKAVSDYDFLSDDSPLMVEAVPVTRDSIMILISKVNDPDDIDPRFARFTTPDDQADIADGFIPSGDSASDSIYDFIEQIASTFGGKVCATDTMEPEVKDTADDPVQSGSGLADSDLADSDPEDSDLEDSDLEDSDLEDSGETDTVPGKTARKAASDVPVQKFQKVFCFKDLDAACEAAAAVCAPEGTKSMLFKDAANKLYYLVILFENGLNETARQVCALMTEYSAPAKSSEAAIAFYREHYELLMKADALNILKGLA